MQSNKLSGSMVVAGISLVGVMIMLAANAATAFVSLEPETTAITNPAVVMTDATASGGKAVKFGTTAATANVYRPYKINSPLELPHAPRDANYVMWNFPAGTMLHQAFQTLGPNDILVLPERAAPYEIDSSRGFISDGTRIYSMAAAKRGVVGLGPGVVIQPSASSFTMPTRSTSTEGNQNNILMTTADNSYFGNFEMRGRTFGQAAYDATWQLGNNSIWERLYFNGAHRGWSGIPPGETGAVTGYRGTNQQVYNVEVDCRDPATGVRVGTSPVMFNAQSNVRMDDVYLHHAYTGMPTFWRVTNVTTNRMRSEFNGSGSKTGYGANHESVSGTVTHNNPTFIIDLPNNPDSHHLVLGTDDTNAVYNINNPTIDTGHFGPGVFDVMIYPYPRYAQNQANIHVTGKPYRIQVGW